MAHKGVFRPKNLQKYVGNVKKIVYRSSWERHFMKWCDDTKSILRWSSEEKIISYRSPITGKMRRYFPDFWIRMKDKGGKIVENIIEIKPFAQCSPPKKKKSITKRYLREVETFLINEAKWKAAKRWCEKRNMDFVVLTERNLYG